MAKYDEEATARQNASKARRGLVSSQSPDADYHDFRVGVDKKKPSKA